MYRNKSIFYVNYSPYENAGRILDYLLENFEYVYLCLLSFHPLGKKQNSNRLVIYKNKKIVKKIFMGHIFVPSGLIFFLLPLRSFVNLLQLFWSVLMIRSAYPKIDIFFSVNAFTSWCGMVLKKIGLVGKTIFWVWDYYPLWHENKIIEFMRKIYWQFDKWATMSDRVVYLSQRLAAVRKKAGVIPKNAKYSIVPIGTDITESRVRNKSNELKIGFIGVLKKTQGLDLLFEYGDELKRNFPTICYEIIGSGPDKEYFEKRAADSGIKTTFHGYVGESKFIRILSQCTIGIAPYVPGDNNLSTYGDPEKVKKYLSFGLPIITTNVFQFSKEVERSGAGIIIDYFNQRSLVSAIRKIIRRYSFYSHNAVKLNRKYYYKEIYPEIFE